MAITDAARRHHLGVLTVLVPFIGYPRTLNGLAGLDEVAGPATSGFATVDGQEVVVGTAAC